MAEVNVSGRRVELEEYIREAKRMKAVLERYSKAELVRKQQGYVTQAQEMKRLLISPDDPSSN